MIAPARIVAFEALLAVEARGTTLGDALASSAPDQGRSYLDARDRALATEIAAGTLRWQAMLDFLVADLTNRPAHRLDAEVRVVLRMAIYQLRHLDRVPPAAVVSDAVDLTRRAGKGSAAGLVNAALRTLQRRGDRLGLPERPDTDPGTADDRRAALDYLATTLSHPRWLAERWLGRFGLAQTAARMAFDNAPAPVTLRANRLRLDRDELAARLAEEGVETRPSRHAPDGLVVIGGSAIGTRAATEGLCVVQDEASQLVARLVGPRPGDRVLDACASPGGKATAMAEAMADRGLLAAVDARARRIRLLRSTVARSGAGIIRVVRADASRQLPFVGDFDVVLLDVPCSGLGIIRRDPDVRWRRTESDLGVLAERQRRMLANAADVVRPGGLLVYATCSSEPDENQDVVATFLSSDRRFHAEPPPDDARDLAPFVDDAGHFRTSPTAHGLDAFYGVRLRRAVTARGSS